MIPSKGCFFVTLRPAPWPGQKVLRQSLALLPVVIAAGAVAAHYLSTGDRVGLSVLGGAGIVEVVAKAGPRGERPESALLPAERQREQALGMLSTLVGELVLSRAVGDDALSRELRDAARQLLPVGG